MVLKYVDLPQYHPISSPECQEFFRALKDADNLDLFELKSIRLLIEYLWPRAKKHTTNRLFIPFIFYLFSYWLYTNFTDNLYTEYENQDKGIKTS